MKYLKILLLSLIFVFHTRVNCQEQNRDYSGKSFTLEECIEAAKANYPAIKRFNLLESTKEYTVKDINLDALPKVNIMLRGSYQSEVTHIPISLPGSSINPISKDQYAAVVNIEQKIWDGGISNAGRSEAEALLEQEKSELRGEIYTIGERVMTLYMGVVLIDRHLNLNQLQIKEIQRVINRVESLIETGYASPPHLLTAKAEEIQLLQKGDILRAERESYTAALSRMTGIEIGTTAKLVAPTGVVPSNLAINREEIIIFQNMKKVVEVKYKYLDAANMPKISAFVQAGYARPALNMLNNSFDPFYVAGVRAVWDIGGFNTKRNDRRILANTISRIENREETFLYNTDIKKLSAIKKIEGVKELLKGDEKIIELRESICRDSFNKMESGVISVSDHLREMNLLEVAQSNKLKREIELIIAVQELKFILNQ